MLKACTLGCLVFWLPLCFMTVSISSAEMVWHLRYETSPPLAFHVTSAFACPPDIECHFNCPYHVVCVPWPIH
ncbi:hypothetical protein PAXINDRAFT_165052 [Paxillus involutus ATCC 200175]|nr:hypothetical protein PAXINDRAFT_165052 [Paxillus involutus ATCC 200175]